MKSKCLANRFAKRQNAWRAAAKTTGLLGALRAENKIKGVLRGSGLSRKRNRATHRARGPEAGLAKNTGEP